MATRVPILQNSLAHAASMRSTPPSALTSSRNAPTTTPTAATLALVRNAAVNGGKAIGTQRAAVEYLADDCKLQIPAGLIRPLNAVLPAADAEAFFALRTLDHLCGVGGVPEAVRNVNITNRAITSVAAWAGTFDQWLVNTAGTYTTGGDQASVNLSYHVGSYDANGNPVARPASNPACDATIELKFGPNADQFVAASIPIDAGVASPPNLTTLYGNPHIRAQFAAHISSAFSINYCLTDASFLSDPNNRWSDDEIQNEHDEDWYVCNLAPYTMSMLAALNVTCLGNRPILAWTRAYGIGFKLLPSTTSIHNIEYQTTEFLPENAELELVVNDHPIGESGQRYARACMSLIAAFGACHLANDHTYKQNDANLRRKAKVYVNACRTTLNEATVTDLASDACLKDTIRTTCHCFGLSSTLGMFYDGQRNKQIAEPLQIRRSVVPPPVAKVGLVVAILGKILALPIGDKLGETYADARQALDTLSTQVVSNAAAYSALHKHYGIDAQQVLSKKNEAMCDSMLPLCAAYAEIFEIDDDGNAAGASLSQVIMKTRVNQAALVGLYANAFQKYIDDSGDIVSLIAPKEKK